MSSGVAGVPTLLRGAVCARAAAQPTLADRAMTDRKCLNRKDRIGHLPLTVYLPGLRGIEAVVIVQPLTFGDVYVPLLEFGKLGRCRLSGAPFVRAASRNDRLFPVPTPGKDKPGMRLGKHGLLNLRVFPCLSAVHGDLDLRDLAPAGPSHTPDLVKSPPGHLHSPRRAQDARFGWMFESEPVDSAVRVHFPVFPVEL